MKIVTISQTCLNNYTKDPEMLQKAKRPCAVIVSLSYKNSKYDFAIPFRSNINPGEDKRNYFPLPPRSTTKPGFRHGLHYTKMFPIKKSYQQRYRTEGNKHAELMKTILNNNEKRIVSECQAYLARYEVGERTPFSTNLDLLISILESTL